MKQKYYNIFVLFLATIIFFVGAGVTVVDLCCSKCVDRVLSMDLNMDDCSTIEDEIESPSCCSEEGNTAYNSDDITLCVSEHVDKCCEAKRVSIDLERSLFQPSLLYSMIWTVIPSFFSDVYITSDNNELPIAGETRDPILIPPRNYLSLIRVLII